MDVIRLGLDISVSRWKTLLAAFCLFSFAVMLIEGLGAAATFSRGTVGKVGLQADAVVHEGRTLARVRGFEPWSRAPQAGLLVGDLVVRANWWDGGRVLAPGEWLPYTVVRGTQTLTVRVETVARPVDPADGWHIAANAVLCVLGTLLGLAIGWRQAELRTSRALALAFLWWSANLGHAYAPAGWLAALCILVQYGALVPGWYLGLWFAVHYPDERPEGPRRVLRRALPFVLLAMLVVEIAVLASAVGLVSDDVFGWASTPFVGLAGVLMLVAFWDGWRHSGGEHRQRFSWLLGSFGLLWSASFVSWLGSFVDDALVATVIGKASVGGSLLAMIGLTYAILRHRVLDLGLAVNRSLVFTVVGAALLGSFHFLNAVMNRLLHFDDPTQAGLLSGLLAALVVLAYPKVKPRAEWLVDRLFFSQWVAREAELARFTSDAAGYTDADALGQGLVGALDRFTAAAGAALYARQAEGHFERQPGATLEAPERVPADEPLVVSLRAGRDLATAASVHSALPGALALLVSRQREPEAFVLIGAPPGGRALRADEVVALRDALKVVGHEWQALRWAALRLQAKRPAVTSP